MPRKRMIAMMSFYTLDQLDSCPLGLPLNPQVIGRTSELLDASNEQRKSCELALEQRHRQISKLDTAFKSASQEVMKVCGGWAVSVLKVSVWCQQCVLLPLCCRETKLYRNFKEKFAV